MLLTICLSNALTLLRIFINSQSMTAVVFIPVNIHKLNQKFIISTPARFMNIQTGPPYICANFQRDNNQDSLLVSLLRVKISKISKIRTPLIS